MKLETRKTFKFKLINQKDPIFSHIKLYFEKMIQPYYGNQSKALKKIGKSNGRNCEVLFREGKEIGLLVYKTKLNNEFTALDIEDSFEIKTLFVINPEKNSGKGVASTLLFRVTEEALKMKAKSIIVTVSTGKHDAMKFFQDKGFEIFKIFKNKYVKGYDEYLFVHPNPLFLLQTLKKYYLLSA